MTVQTDVRTPTVALCSWLLQDYDAKFPQPKDPSASLRSSQMNLDRLACRMLLTWVTGRDQDTRFDEVERRRSQVTVAYFQEFMDFLEEHKRQEHFSSYMEARMNNIML